MRLDSSVHSPCSSSDQPDSWSPTVPRPSQLLASLPNLGARSTHRTLPSPAWTHLQGLLAFPLSWKALPPRVQRRSSAEEKPSTSPFSGFPRVLLLTWRAWWLVLAATPLNLHSPNPSKGSVSGRVSTALAALDPWGGGRSWGTLHWSLAAEALGATARTVDLTASTERQGACSKQGEEKGRTSVRSGRGAEIGQVLSPLQPLPPVPPCPRQVSPPYLHVNPSAFFFLCSSPTSL